MPSQAMQDVIDTLRDRRKASASQTPPTLKERRANFVPGDRLHPVPDDVLVREVIAGGVPAHWLAAPEADTGRDPISTPGMLRQFASDYLAGADPKSPLASPLFAPLSGLPPLLIQVGTADLLLSDSERLATAAAGAGVDVTLQIGEGLPHVYQLLLGTPEAAEATEQIGKFLQARVRSARL